MTALRVAVVPSALLAAVIGATHVAAAVMLWLVPLALPLQALLTIAIAGSLVYLIVCHALLRAPHSIVALHTRDGGVSLQARNGAWLEGDVLGSSYVSPCLTIVNFQPRGRWRVLHVILVADNVDSDEFRRLRTWLRWKRGDPAFIEPA